MTAIPSDEDFDRASDKIGKQFVGLDVVKKNVVRHFNSRCPLYAFYILPQGENRLRAYVFFKTDRDVEECNESGVVDEFERFIIEELAKVDRWGNGQTTIVFELDSDENVRANYEGDYFLRLR